jgi:uncharacterized protein YjiS (DUF1127 family)
MITAAILVLTAVLLTWRFRRIAAAIGRWRAHEAAVTELARLDDKTLADIGLHRSEIRSAVMEANATYVPRERRHRRVVEPPRPAQASWQGAPVRPLDAATATPAPRPANDPTRPRRSA